MTRIAFLGLGAMGTRMASNLHHKGFDVVGWNRSPMTDPALPIANSIEDAVKDADIVIAMVTDDAASAAVWSTAFPAMPAGALAVEASTVSPARIAAFSHEAETYGLRAIAAPVAGSRPQAEAAELLFMTGGRQEDTERFQPAAEAMGKAALYAGSVEQAAALKLIVNGLLAIQTAAMGEILKFAKSAGFTPDAAMDLLAPVPVTSPAAAFVGRQIAAGQHEPMFTVDLMAKDLGYLTEGREMPVLSEVLASFVRAQNAGHGGQHITAAAA